MEKPGSRRKLKVWGMAAFRERDKALKDTGAASARKVVAPVQQVVVLVRIGGFAAA
ncbi:hypothetical protein D9M71_746490 [compost metagenome]